MMTYTETVQELACLERLRRRTEDAELAQALSLRLRGGVDTLAYMLEVDKRLVMADVRLAADIDGAQAEV